MAGPLGRGPRGPVHNVWLPSLPQHQGGFPCQSTGAPHWATKLATSQATSPTPLLCDLVQGRRLPQGGTGPTWESEPRWDIKHRVWVQLQGLRQTLLPSRPPSVLCPETGWSPRTPQQPQAEGGRRQASPKDSVVSRTPLRGCGHLAPGSSLSRTGCVLGKSWVHVYNEGVVSPA